MSDLKYRPEEKIDESYTPRAGDRVFWYPTGDPRDKPHAAIVNVDCGPQRVVSLSIFYNGVVEKSAVKHLSVNATEIDRRSNGGWAWNRTYESAVTAPEKPKVKK
jgi:hypothetical protein